MCALTLWLPPTVCGADRHRVHSYCNIEVKDSVALTDNTFQNFDSGEDYLMRMQSDGAPLSCSFDSNMFGTDTLDLASAGFLH